jgi:hypothetical protein
MSRARDNAHVSGRAIQTVQRLSSNYGTVSTVAYNNDPNNLVQIPDHYVDIVTKSANSRIKVSFSFDNMGPNIQHSYTDVRRSISGGSFTSMAINYRTGAIVDSLASFHTTGTGNVEHSSMYTIIDSPNVAAGTTLRYQVYMGSWAGGSVNFGGWNSNAVSLTIMIAEELAQ